MALTDYFQGAQQTAQAYNPATNGVQVTPTAQLEQKNLSTFLNPDSTLMQQAKQQGLETAAERGGINSSIAAGAAQRAALGTASSMASAATQGDLQYQNTLLNNDLTNWQNTQNYNRELYGNLYGQTFSSSLQMQNALGAAALQDPETYTPEVMSGFSNFFNKSLADQMSQYFQ